MGSVDKLLAQFDTVAEEVQTLTFLARAAELQEAALGVADQFLETLRAHKAAFVSAGDEPAANQSLAMELALQAVRAELSMWLRLKRDDPDGAWDDLVTAQDTLSAAAAVRRQIGVDTGRLDNLGRKLVLIEQYLFPPQMFNSIGGIVTKRECSICGSDYDSCNHIRGRAYMGQLCRTIIREYKVREMSIVMDPADKRCRITHFSDQGKLRNKMTWRLEDRSLAPPNHARHLTGANSK
jgi:hypothetical protein